MKIPTEGPFRYADTHMSCGKARTHDHRTSSQRLTLSRHTGTHVGLTYAEAFGYADDIAL